VPSQSVWVEFEEEMVGTRPPNREGTFISVVMVGVAEQPGRSVKAWVTTYSNHMEIVELVGPVEIWAWPVSRMI
jgi:hypothetical protein